MKGKKIACCAGLTVLSTLLFSCSYKAASSGGIGWYAASRSQNMNEMLADVALSEKLAEKEEFDPRNFDHIAVKGKEFPANERPNVNLVFLVDVSGSMEPANRLPLVIESLKMLVEELNGADKVAICVYLNLTHNYW